MLELGIEPLPAKGAILWLERIGKHGLEAEVPRGTAGSRIC